MYKVRDNTKMNIAKKLVEEYDYNAKAGKIPLGVLYKSSEPTLEDKWPQLTNLMKRKVNWQKK